jgi:sulfite exporter TauE/SafE/copper chaperone CopZ
MNGKRITLYVDGMTCGSCESRIKKVVSGLSGVLSAEAQVRGGKVTVDYDEDRIGIEEIKSAIEKTGYPISGNHGAGTAIAIGIGLFLVSVYLIASASGAFSSLPKIDANVGYAMLFVIGLLTSIHCVAMCGGIALSQSVGTQCPRPDSDKPDVAERLRQLRPGLLYNAGRVVSYTAIGAAVGALGAVFGFSPVVKGIIAALAGAFMIAHALRMMGVIRSSLSAAYLVPASLRKSTEAFASRMRRGGPFAVGILNGLMPCGPLQTMQLYALGTGSAIAGALSMLVFSAGTVPLMLLFGLTAAFLPRKFVPIMVKASAVLVMFLGVVTFARAAALAGFALPSLSVPTSAITSGNTGSTNGPSGNAVNAGLIKATVSGDTQTVITEFQDGYYVPFAVQAGIPLTWTIRIAADDLNGCNEELVIPEYNIRKKLEPGDNVIEFTPTKAGRIAYSCWMGMIRSSITAAESLGNSSSFADLPDEPLAFPRGGGCCAVR